MARVIAFVLVVGFGSMGLSGGLWSSQSAEPTAQAFLLAWQEQQYQAAAALTTGRPAAVADALQNAYTELDAAAFYLQMGPITQHGDTAQASFRASVDLGQDGAPWEYGGDFTLRRTGGDWRVVWSPSVINPALKPGLRLAVLSEAETRAPLLDSAGHPLQVPSTVYLLGVRPDRLRHPLATARALARATALDPSQLLGWILAAPSAKFQELVVMRPSEYQRLAAKLSRVPGLIVRTQKLPLFDSIAPGLVGSVGAEDSSALRDQGIAYRPGATIGLSGLQAKFQRQLAGTPTTEVVAETANGRRIEVLKKWIGHPPEPVRTTIQSAVQRAAQSAIGAVPGSAAIVAVQASTGRIVAVATNRSQSAPAIDPLAGRYPPGAAFTLVSTQALLDSGLRANAVVPCRSFNEVGGTVFRNVPPTTLGTQPAFTADFAKACSAAFAGLSRRLSFSSLAKTAGQFGIGTRWQFPLRAFSGTVGAAGGVAGLAADTIGQGSVRMSPLAMALVAAQVASGAWHAPVLVIPQAEGQRAGSPTALNGDSLAELRSLLRAAARSNGAAAAGASGRPVLGQVGAAPVVEHGHRLWANWFAGYRGDIAFAVMLLSHSPATSAVPVATQFLAGAPRG